MARPKKQIKVKEPVRLREQQLADGRKSLYLDIYYNGKRSYKFLKLYLLPETDFQTKAANMNTLELANVKKKEKIQELTNKVAGIVDNSHKSKVTFVTWMETYMNDAKERGAYSVWILRVINELKRYDPNITLADVNREFLIKFMDHLLTRPHLRNESKKMCKSTVFLYMDYLRAALNFAVKEKVIPSTPYKRISRDMVRVTEHKREYLTVEEVKRLMKTPLKQELIKRAFLFSCFCGLRIQDIIDLKWKNIIKNGTNWQVEIIQFKTKQPLYLPLNMNARNWLPEQGDSSSDDRVFPKLSHDCKKIIPVFAQSAGIEKHVTFHVARHTFATLCLTAGIDIYTTSQLLGHASIRHTQRYAKIINSKKDEAVSRLDEAF